MDLYEKCLKDIAMQRGTPPYNGFNPVMGDGYFYQQILRDYPEDLITRAIKECKEKENEIKNLIKKMEKK